MSQNNKMILAIRYLGAMVGLAVGDAVGTTLEFKPVGTFEPITDMLGGGPFNLNQGEWTDDTSMALCLAESLIKKNEFDPTDQIERYIRWHENGYMSSTGSCFDIGNTIHHALASYKLSGNPYSGNTDPFSAGNGSIMRLAPVPLFYAFFPEKAIKLSGESSKTTHQAETAIDACRYFGALISGAVRGKTKEELLSKRFCLIDGYWEKNPLVKEIDEIACGSFKEKHPPEIKGTGYVVKSLEAALWAFYHSTTFKDGLLMAVNLGDDADTTGAVYGQLAGAYYGYMSIPKEWRDKIALKKTIHEISIKLAELAAVRLNFMERPKLQFLHKVNNEGTSVSLEFYIWHRKNIEIPENRFDFHALVLEDGFVEPVYDCLLSEDIFDPYGETSFYLPEQLERLKSNLLNRRVEFQSVKSVEDYIKIFDKDWKYPFYIAELRHPDFIKDLELLIQSLPVNKEGAGLEDIEKAGEKVPDRNQYYLDLAQSYYPVIRDDWVKIIDYLVSIINRCLETGTSLNTIGL